MSCGLPKRAGGRISALRVRQFTTGSHLRDRSKLQTAGRAVRDFDKTETEQSMRANLPAEQRPVILWVYPEYGRMTLPVRRHLVGRSQSCDTVLPGTKISREHAELSPVG